MIFERFLPNKLHGISLCSWDVLILQGPPFPPFFRPAKKGGSMRIQYPTCDM